MLDFTLRTALFSRPRNEDREQREFSLFLEKHRIFNTLSYYLPTAYDQYRLHLESTGGSGVGHHWGVSLLITEL